ncbi:MAG TPA: hypothetical protein ENO38_01495 [Nitrososphaeria archaeon]|nr:hypothetical protein [Nitrososphaeria archaeon]
MSKASKKAEKGKEKGKQPERERAKGVAEGKARADALLVEDPKYVLEKLRPLKALTIYSVAQALGVKGSTASALLRKLVESGAAVKVGGYSGHYVYAIKEDSAQSSPAIQS